MEESLAGREREPQREVAMRTVRDVMSGDIEVLGITETAADAAGFLATHSEDDVPLCLADGSLAGMVSNHDIVAKVVAKGLDPRVVTLAELAEPTEPSEVLSLDADLSVEDAVAVMCRHHRARLPVTEHDRVIGLVTQRDVARSLQFVPSWVDAFGDA
jgi:CBS domain-containing protein